MSTILYPVFILRKSKIICPGRKQDISFSKIIPQHTFFFVTDWSDNCFSFVLTFLFPFWYCYWLNSGFQLFSTWTFENGRPCLYVSVAPYLKASLLSIFSAVRLHSEDNHRLHLYYSDLSMLYYISYIIYIYMYTTHILHLKLLLS